jgi:tetratricopeptide (TPR) repeat protein
MRVAVAIHSSFILVLCCAWLVLNSGAHAAQESPAVAEKFQQATAAMRAGDLDAAAAAFESVIHEAPRFAEAYFDLGLVRQQQGRNADAIPVLEHALALKPTLRGANLFLGIAHYQLTQNEAAIAALQREVKLNPRDPKAWMWLGVAQLAAEKPDDAVVALDKAAALAPEDVDILYHRGRAHLLVSKSSYTRMFKVDAHSWRVHEVLAQADAESEHHADAIAEFLAAIQLAPNEPGLHEELGSEYRNDGKLAEAEAAFKAELELNPLNYLARYKLGALAVEAGDGARGKELIEAALRQKPDLLNADYNLGRAEMQIGDDAGAAILLERATKSSSEPEIIQQAWYQLAIVLRRLHRLPEAQQAMAVFQKLKEEDAAKSQNSLKKYQSTQDPNAAPPTPENPN